MTDTVPMERQAMDLAKAIVQKRFSDEASLDEVAAFRDLYLLDLSQSRSQLNALVHSQLDVTRRAHELITEAHKTMSSLRTEFGDMQTQALAYKGQLGGHKHIRALNVASRNIRATMTRVENFSAVPVRVQRLQQALVENPGSLKTVFMEAQDLEDWRDALIDEVKGKQPRNKKAGYVEEEDGSGSPTKELAFSPELYNRILDVLGGHFAVVNKLSEDIRETVLDHLGSCVDLAQESPALLVRALEVLVMIDENTRRKMLKLTEEERENLFAPENGFEEDALDHINKSFDKRIQGTYKNAMSQAADEKKTAIEGTLSAANRGLVDINMCKSYVVGCFPPHMKILDMYRTRFESFMIPKVAGLYNMNIHAIEIGELLQLTRWLQQYNNQIVLNCSGPPTKDFVSAIDVLMAEYLVRMREQTKEWFSNIDKRPLELGMDAEGYPITRSPEDQLNIVNLQMAVAREQLPQNLAYKAIKVCMEELQVAQERSRVSIEQKWKDMEIHHLCAIVNDSYRMQDKCEGLFDKLQETNDEDNRGDAASLKMLLDTMDALCRGYAELALLGAKLCADSVMEDIKRPVITLVFTKEWEEGQDIIATLVFTLKDYFDDLQALLPDYFFSKIVRLCYEQSMSGYVESAFMKKKKEFADPFAAAQVLVNDRELLEQFFVNKFAVQLEAAGLRESSAIMKPLEVMTNMSRVLKCTKASDAEEPLSDLMMQFGVQAIDVATTVATKRKLDSAALKEWKFMIQHVANQLGDGLEFMQHIYNLPQFALPSPASNQVVAPGASQPQHASAANDAAKKAVEKAKVAGWFSRNKNKDATKDKDKE